MDGRNGFIDPDGNEGSTVDDPAAAVVAGYDQLASHWDDWADDVHPDLRAEYLKRLEAQLSPGSDVLELGCGTGRPVAARLATIHRYVGIDSSPQMVKLAQRSVPDGRFHVADMTALNLSANSFDAVVAFYSVIHVPRDDQPELFSRIRSWLRPNGLFVGCLTGGDLPEGWEDDWLGGGPMYWSGFDADTNRRLLEEAGLEVGSSEVIAQMEGDTEVCFLWVEAHRSQVHLPADPGKYSVSELKRRFLLSELPPGLSQPRRIRDLYIEGTRLRLRTVEDADGVVLQRKLGHKRQIDEANPSINHTSQYLNEREYETLSPLPGRSVVKTRWIVEANGRRAAVDVFEGELQGLTMLEVNFDTYEDMNVYTPPAWAGVEVSQMKEFSGGELSALESEELEEVLRAASPPSG